MPRCGGPRPGRRWRPGRDRCRCLRRVSARRDRHRDRDGDDVDAHGSHCVRRRLFDLWFAAWRLRRAHRARRVPPRHPRGHPRRHGRHDPPERRAAGRRPERDDDRHCRHDAPSRRLVQSRPGRGQRKDHRPPPERPQLRQPGRPGPRRRTPAGFVAAADQRRPAADQRVPVRRHLGPPARTWPGGVLSERRRHPGFQDREQQPAGGIRPLQRRRGQSDDEVRQQRPARHALRVLPPRSPERPQLFRVGQPGQAAVPPQSVRRGGGRPRSPRRDVLFSRLPGTAAGDWPHGHLDGADGAAASGRLHRVHRRPGPGHLRSGDDHAGRRRRDAHSVRGWRHPVGAHRSGGPHAPRAVSTAERARHCQQLPADRQRVGRSGSVQPAHRSASDEPRPAVRAPDALPRSVHPGDAPARRQRRDERNARAAGHHGVGLRLVLPARLLGFAPERAAHRRHAAHGRPCRRSAPDLGIRRAGAARHPVLRGIPRHAADVPDRRLSAARLTAQHRHRLRDQRDADRRHDHVGQGTAHPQGRRRPALGTPERRAAPIANRLVHVQQPVHGPARHGEHRHTVRQLSARPGAAVLDRPSAGRDSQPRVVRGGIRPGRLAALGSPGGERRPALHPELPVG